MAESIKKMDSIINSLVSWLNEYPVHILTVAQKHRIVQTLERLKKAEPITEEELKHLKSFEYKRIVNYGLGDILQNPQGLNKEIPSKLKSFICAGCEKKIQSIHKKAHRRKCVKWKNLHKPSTTVVEYFKYSEGTSPLNDLPGRNYSSTGNELKDHQLAERKADGSRDHSGYRENGRFGSSSSYDDYGDEAEA